MRYIIFGLIVRGITQSYQARSSRYIIRSLNTFHSVFENMEYPIIASNSVCHVLGYRHLGIAVSNINESINFYNKIGFDLESSSSSGITVLKNQGGLQLHLFVCDLGIEDGKNILMDYPQKKYPGHTHASFTVPNVARVKEYFDSVDIQISGDRTRGGRLYAYFARDPDRTTLEFEKNHGDPEDVVITRNLIGYPQSIDHIGIRVTQPETRFLFYAEKLGFIKCVNKYEANPDPLKNNPPWISRTISGCDINFIINANESPDENILIANGIVRPGIVYATFSVADVFAAETGLKAAGVHVVREEDIASSKWACLSQKFIPTGHSIFIEDDDHNILRLVSSVL